MSQPLYIMTQEQIEAFGRQLLDGYIQRTAPPTASAPIELITPEELCKRLDISIPTQIRYRKKGKLPYMVIGNQLRYDWHEVLKALKK